MNRLVGSGHRLNVDKAFLLVEADFAFHERVDREITPDTDILATVPFGAALANNDVARDNVLAAEFLNAEAFALTVASVLYGALTFLVSHKERSWLNELAVDRLDREAGQP
jgi:hypothetical protein